MVPRPIAGIFAPLASTKFIACFLPRGSLEISLHHDLAADDARLIGAAFFCHWTLGLIHRRQLFANAAPWRPLGSPQAREVRCGLGAAHVKRSPPKRLRNASAVAGSGKQNRIYNCSASRLRPRRSGMPPGGNAWNRGLALRHDDAALRPHRRGARSAPMPCSRRATRLTVTPPGAHN